MIQIMTVANQLYSSLSFLARQSRLMVTELPKCVQCLSDFSSLNTVSNTCNMHGDARIEGYHYCMPLETLLALNYNSFILTVGIVGVDSHVRDMYSNNHSQGTCVLLEIPSILKNKIRKGPCYICSICNRLLYKRSVHFFGKSKYLCENFFSVQSSFNRKQYVCKTCQLIETFSSDTSVPLLTVRLHYQNPVKTTPRRNPAT